MVRGEFSNALYELGNSLFRERAQRHEGHALFLEIVRELRRQLGHELLGDFVELVSRDEERTLVKLGVVLAHLAAHDLEIFYDGVEIAAFKAQHMYQKPRPVHVAQEFEAEPLVLVRALDKAGDSPLFSCAPSIRPGMSAMTILSSPVFMTPRFGDSVVKG